MAVCDFQIQDDIEERFKHDQPNLAAYHKLYFRARVRHFDKETSVKIAYAVLTPGYAHYLDETENPDNWARKKNWPKQQRSKNSRKNTVKRLLKANKAFAGSEDADFPNLPCNADQFVGKKKCTPRMEVEWVHENMHRSDVRPQDAPSAGAWGTLHRARADRSFRAEFDRAWYKLLPTRTELNEAGIIEDDGREQLDILERLETEAVQTV